MCACSVQYSVVYTSGGPPRLTFGNQGLINKDLGITSSILCIALSVDYTFEFFRSEPKIYHPKTLWRCSLDVYVTVLMKRAYIAQF